MRFRVILVLFSITGSLYCQSFGSLAISAPPGFEVFVDGNPMGVTNELEDGKIVERISVGRHSVLIRKAGYSDFRTEIVVEANKTVLLKPQIEQATISVARKSGQDLALKQQLGILYVRSLPVGAEIYLNGKRIGLCDSEVANVPVGSHTIMLQFKGNKLELGIDLVDSDYVTVMGNFIQKTITATSRLDEESAAAAAKIDEERKKADAVRAAADATEKKKKLEEAISKLRWSDSRVIIVFDAYPSQKEFVDFLAVKRTGYASFDGDKYATMMTRESRLDIAGIQNIARIEWLGDSLDPSRFTDPKGYETLMTTPLTRKRSYAQDVEKDKIGMLSSFKIVYKQKFETYQAFKKYDMPYYKFIDVEVRGDPIIEYRIGDTIIHMTLSVHGDRVEVIPEYVEYKNPVLNTYDRVQIRK